MEHTRKMVLVPQEVYNAMKYSESKSHTEPKDKAVKILEDSSLPADHKMRLYNHELQKTLDTKRKQVVAQVEMTPDHHHGDLIEKEVIHSLPRTLQVKGKLLLERLRANNVSWSRTGELVIDSKQIDGTNVIDLVNDILRNRKHSSPYGWEIFANKLAKLNTPQELVVNKARWNYISKRKNVGISHDENVEDKSINEETWETF